MSFPVSFLSIHFRFHLITETKRHYRKYRSRVSVSAHFPNCLNGEIPFLNVQMAAHVLMLITSGKINSSNLSFIFFLTVQLLFYEVVEGKFHHFVK